MDINIKSITNILQIITLLGAVVPIMRILVNALTAHELDRLFKTPWKKFIETSILILMSSFLVTAMIFFELKEASESWPNNTDELIGIFLALYLLVVSFITLAAYPVSELVKNFCNRSYFFIEDHEEKWIIEISEDRGRFYLRNGDKNKIVTSLDNNVILRDIKQTDQAKKVYSKITKYKFLKILTVILLILSIVTVVTSIIMLLMFNNILYFFQVGFFAYILAIIAIFLSGWNDYEKFQQSNNE
ncbi:hypothetical protein ACULLL_10035 [Lysinibacillus irui]|uniref:hypothetical protein n=1 Tax=Lysinibacillus irui TaxID=2998077 RepID=UPI004044582A